MLGGRRSSFDECSQEGCSGPVVNKKYKLCERHNWERIHGEDYYEHKRRKKRQQQKRARKRAMEKDPSGSKRHGIRAKSTKQARMDASIQKAYESVRDRDGRRCTGCGQRQHLSHSHLVPRSRRKDLRDDPDNIVLQCVLRRDGSLGCHQRYEKFRAYELKNFDDLMERLRSLDKTYFELYRQEMDENRTTEG